jgi:hypothetical protein
MTPAARDVAHGQSRRGGGGGSNKPGSRPPLDFDVMERLDDIQNTLGGWVRHVGEERGSGLLAGWPRKGADLIVEAARLLQGHLEWLRHRQEAQEALDDIAKAARAIMGIADGPIPGRYAGPCSHVGEDGEVCGEDVTARPGSRIGRCKVCGAEYDVDEQQAWMRSEIEDYLARPVEIAGVLLRLGFPIGYSTIAAYAAKGQLAAHGNDQEGRPLYRIGDVMTLRMGVKK